MVSARAISSMSTLTFRSPNVLTVSAPAAGCQMSPPPTDSVEVWLGFARDPARRVAGHDKAVSLRRSHSRDALQVARHIIGRDLPLGQHDALQVLPDAALARGVVTQLADVGFGGRTLPQIYHAAGTEYVLRDSSHRILDIVVEITPEAGADEVVYQRLLGCLDRLGQLVDGNVDGCRAGAGEMQRGRAHGPLLVALDGETHDPLLRAVDRMQPPVVGRGRDSQIGGCVADLVSYLGLVAVARDGRAQALDRDFGFVCFGIIAAGRCEQGCEGC